MKVVKNNDFQNIEMYRRIENKLPSDWCVESIRNICDLQNGMAFKPDDKNDQGIGLPVVRIQNLNGSDKCDYYDKEVKKQFLIKNGDVLFAWSATLGGYLWKGGDAILNQHIFNVIPKGSTNKTWLYYLFNTIIKSRAYNDAHGGGGMVHVKKGVVQDYLIPFPPKDEQEKIANFLSERESYLQSIQTLISKMEQRNQYYLNKALEVMSDVNNGADKHNLSELVSFIKGNAFKKSDMDDVGDYPIIKMNNFKDGKVAISDRTLYTDNVAKNSKLEKGDLLIGMSGSVGASAIFELDAESYLNQRIIALRLKDDKFENIVHNIMPHYIRNLIQREIIGGAIKNVSYKHIENLNFYADMEELSKKADELSKLENELSLVKQLYSKEKQVFQWLCEKLVSGEYKIED